MNMELQKVWETLREIYGNGLMAATLVVLVEEGDGGVNYVSAHYPQEPE